MKELLTEAECKALFRSEVEKAGGAKKWLRKNKILGMDHVLHMIAEGRYFTHYAVLAALGLKPVERWERIVSPATPDLIGVPRAGE